MTKEALLAAREALNLAMENLRPHGDNCFLHDEGEYNSCFCGKDSLENHLIDQLALIESALSDDVWQPIETAPKDGTDVIVMYMHIDTQIVHNAFYMGEDADNEDGADWWSYDHSEVSRIRLDGWMTPTHWMHLPPPPAAAQKGAV